MKIIFDPFYSYTDDIFSKERAKDIIGGTWIPLLYEMVKEQGGEMLLANRYLQEGVFSSKDLFLCDGVSPNYAKLIASGAIPFLLFSGESPNVDWQLYAFASKNSRHFLYTMLFEGCRPYVSKNTQFIPYNWPNSSQHQLLPVAEKKKKLVMIASNKKQHFLPGQQRIVGAAKKLLMKAVTSTIPSVKLTDLYAYRMKAIQYFSGTGFFSLYGRNWTDHSTLTANESKAIAQLQPAAIGNKFEVLANYQFALCFENCIYPGYITEKIFDCFTAGTIPVYMGAPDIEKYIPEDLFIDMRSFSDFASLHSFLEAMSEEETRNYRQRISAYLQSAGFARYQDITYAKNIFHLLKQQVEKTMKPSVAC
ncbi:MAG TPA: glycosyltransferase family 10 [Flavisolibacter sp.]|nr:glycosyltransferase family 10 [Flavisolibacter sp.]